MFKKEALDEGGSSCEKHILFTNFPHICGFQKKKSQRQISRISHVNSFHASASLSDVIHWKNVLMDHNC